MRYGYDTDDYDPIIKASMPEILKLQRDENYTPMTYLWLPRSRSGTTPYPAPFASEFQASYYHPFLKPLTSITEEGSKLSNSCISCQAPTHNQSLYSSSSRLYRVFAEATNPQPALHPRQSLPAGQYFSPKINEVLDIAFRPLERPFKNDVRGPVSGHIPFYTPTPHHHSLKTTYYPTPPSQSAMVSQAQARGIVSYPPAQYLTPAPLRTVAGSSFYSTQIHPYRTQSLSRNSQIMVSSQSYSQPALQNTHSSQQKSETAPLPSYAQITTQTTFKEIASEELKKTPEQKAKNAESEIPTATTNVPRGVPLRNQGEELKFEMLDLVVSPTTPEPQSKKGLEAETIPTAIILPTAPPYSDYEKSLEGKKDSDSDTKKPDEKQDEDHDSKSICCLSITTLYNNFTEFLNKISNKFSASFSILSKGFFSALRTRGSDQTQESPNKVLGTDSFKLTDAVPPPSKQKEPLTNTDPPHLNALERIIATKVGEETPTVSSYAR